VEHNPEDNKFKESSSVQLCFRSREKKLQFLRPFLAEFSHCIIGRIPTMRLKILKNVISDENRLSQTRQLRLIYKINEGMIRLN
jgi:hypothetical protein